MSELHSGASASFDLAGRVVIVTGGAKGIGAVYSQHLAAAGARVLLADIDGAASLALAAAICESGGDALGLQVDVSDRTSVDQMAQAALAHFGRIDGLVNNAALMSQLPRGPWENILDEDWDRVMGVNLRGAFMCCRAVYPAMRSQGWGRMVNISSNRVFDGTPNRLHYTTSKAGIIGLTRALAREVGVHGITVNAVAPGYTESDSQTGSSSPAYLAQMAQLNARKAIARTQVPLDLVGAVLFLLGPASGFISGQTLNVDGGFVMH